MAQPDMHLPIKCHYTSHGRNPQLCPQITETMGMDMKECRQKWKNMREKICLLLCLASFFFTITFTAIAPLIFWLPGTWGLTG